jgi:hypothetical protein
MISDAPHAVTPIARDAVTWTARTLVVAARAYALDRLNAKALSGSTAQDIQDLEARHRSGGLGGAKTPPQDLNVLKTPPKT